MSKRQAERLSTLIEPEELSRRDQGPNTRNRSTRQPLVEILQNQEMDAKWKSSQ